MTGLPQILLLVSSVIAWVLCWWKRELVFRWIYAALDRRFAKRPNLDVGLVYLFAIANVAILVLLLSQVLVGKTLVTNPKTSSSNTVAQDGSKQEDRVTPSTEPMELSNDNTVNEVPTTDSGTEIGKDATLVDPTPVSIRAFQTALILVTVILMMGLSYWIYDSALWQWGWGPLLDGRWLATLRVGGLVFILLVPPVLLLHECLSYFAKYQHQTLDTFQQLRTDGDWLSIGLVFLNTAVMVPLLEETIFRGIIQGFAQQFVTFRFQLMRWVMGPMRMTVASWLGLTAAAKEAAAAGKGSTPRTREGFWGPIVFSSLLFGLAHSGQGAAPVSLYFLGMGLGWIYRKTGNLGICVIVHLLLNSWTLIWALF